MRSTPVGHANQPDDDLLAASARMTAEVSYGGSQTLPESSVRTGYSAIVDCCSPCDRGTNALDSCCCMSGAQCYHTCSASLTYEGYQSTLALRSC